MKRLLLAFALLAGAHGLFARGATRVEQQYEPGRPIPVIGIVDDRGVARSTADWRGLPTIIAPMYSRCPLACPLIAAGLKRAAARTSASATDYRVVLFSFDPRDTPGDLKAFRDRNKLPLPWTVATAKPEDVRKLMDALGFTWGQTGVLYSHPNMAVAITPDLKTARTMFGTEYDFDAALRAARGGKDWVAAYGPWMMAVLLLAMVLSAIYLATLLGQRQPQ